MIAFVTRSKSTNATVRNTIAATERNVMPVMSSSVCGVNRRGARSAAGGVGPVPAGGAPDEAGAGV